MKKTAAQHMCRIATLNDLDALLTLESECFTSDRLSRRSFRRQIQSEQSDLVLIEDKKTSESSIVAYGLSLRHKGTRLARLYSLAVSPHAQRRGFAQEIITALENQAESKGKHYMRLEVAKNNLGAIKLYESKGYRVFGEYSDYYEDHSDALRMQKRIRDFHSTRFTRNTPWYQQTTEFTCGPSALMMAMASLNNTKLNQALELDVWREATTIFMTSGHGGCHPLGLALAAKKRGFQTEIWVNNDQPLFIDGVRSDDKKEIMKTVHNHFLEQCHHEDIHIHYNDITQQKLEQWIKKKYAVVALISTYRLDGRKAPHWVCLTGVDKECFYVHDPDVDTQHQTPLDCQFVPIAKEDFDKMSTFGTSRLRTAFAIWC